MKNEFPVARREGSPVFVRQAEADDIPICCRLDGQYQTNYVWQMYFQEDEHTIEARFHKVRLPRTMAVDYPYTAGELEAIFSRSDGLFVACYGDAIIGCIEGRLEPEYQRFSINHLLVHNQARRRGIGSLLLGAVEQVARQYQCRQLTLTAQTKNHPVIAFAQQAGFTYCGYNDRHYRNHDIALIFALAL